MSADVTVPVVTDRYSLLGYPSDLAGYRRALGPIPIPSVVDGNWSQGLIEAIEASGLTGRGGASFPTSIKLASASRAKSNTLIVVNAMEGEPASDKDKVLLTRAPHHVLDGAQLLAAATGASRVVVCVPIGRDAIAGALAHAIAERVAVGHSRVREEVLRPPDRFVAGEESALTMWLHTGESLPRFRPDKSRQLTIDGSRRWSTTPRPWPCGHDRPARSRGLLGPRAPRRAGDHVGHHQRLGGPARGRRDRTWRTVDRDRPARRAIESLQALLVGGYGGTWVGPEHFSMPYASFALRTIGAVAGPGIIVALRTSACGIAEWAASPTTPRAECRPVRAVRLWAPRHCRRPRPCGEWAM